MARKRAWVPYVGHHAHNDHRHISQIDTTTRLRQSETHDPPIAPFLLEDGY